MEQKKSYLERLCITHWSEAQIDWENFEVQVKWTSSIIWLVGKTKTYIVDNVAKLLMLHPEFKNTITQWAITRVRIRDKAITILENELIWEWKPFMITEWKVWWSGWIYWTVDANWNKADTYHPSAEYVTEDVSHFTPINRFFSKDMLNVYFTYHKIWNNQRVLPDVNSFKPIWNTRYWLDHANLFCWFNCVLWADITNWIEIISEEDELIRDSSNTIFSWHKRAEVISPENFKHSCNDFYFDWKHIYLSYGGLTDLTTLYKWNEWEDVIDLWNNKYKVWEVVFGYKDWKFSDIN